jgi:hypothetical protein
MPASRADGADVRSRHDQQVRVSARIHCGANAFCRGVIDDSLSVEVARHLLGLTFRSSMLEATTPASSTLHHYAPIKLGIGLVNVGGCR